MKVDTESADGRRRPRTASSSSCSSTTRSTARSATRAASARCRTRRSATARARAASSRRSATSRSRSRSATLVLLDRERCILCDRCTRFADEVAGDPLIDFTEPGQPDAGAHVPRRAVLVVLQRQHRADLPGRRARRPRRTASRPGRGTSSRSRARARRARSAAASPCSPAATELTRYLGIDSDPVNWGWLCDKGRFDFEAVNSDDRLTAPLRARRAATSSSRPSWGEALDRRRRSSSPRRSPRGGPAAVAVLGGARRHQRGRLRLGQAGQGRPRHRQRRRPAGRRPAGRAACSACRGPPSTRPAAAGHGRAARRPTSRRSCPSCYLRLRDAAEQRTVKLVELGAGSRPASRRYAWRSVPPGRGRRRRRRAAAGARPSTTPSPTSCARRSRSSSSPVGPPWPSRGRDAARAAAACRARSCSPCAGQRARRPRHGPGPGCCPAAATLGRRPLQLRRWPPLPTPGSTPPASSTAAAEGRIDLPRPARRRPARRLPRRATSPAGPSPAPAGSSPSTRSSPSRPAAADVVLPAAAYGEKSGTTTNLEGRVTAVGQKVTAAGHGSRPDWMIAVRAGRPARAWTTSADDAVVGRGDHRRRQPARAGLRRRDQGRPARPAGTACSPCRPRTRRRSPSRCRPHPTGSATPTGWCRPASSTTRPSATATSPSLAAARRRRARRTSTRSTSTASASPSGADVRITSRPRRRRARRSSPTPACPRGSLQVPFNVAGAAAQPTSSTPRRRSPTSGWRRMLQCSAHRPARCDGGLDSGRRWRSSCSRSLVIFVIGLVGTMFMIWFERKVISDMQNRIGPNQAGPFGHPPDARRRHQAVLQGGLPARPGRPVRLPAGAVPGRRPGLPGLSVIPLGGDFSDGHDGTVTWFGHDTTAAAGRPADRHPARAGHVVDRRLRRHAGRLVVGVEVPAARRRCGPRPR